MKLRIDLADNQGKAVTPAQMQNYLAFRTVFPRPAQEDTHVRHIFRFYAARALAKAGYETVLIRPAVEVDGRRLDVDVAAARGGKTVVAVCEPGAVTAESVAKLDVLKDAGDAEVIILHSRHASAGAVPERFREQIASRKFRLMSVVPPPFDDVFEYDIWMFELTFKEAAT